MNEFVLWRTDFWYQSWIGAFTSLKILPTDYHLVDFFYSCRGVHCSVRCVIMRHFSTCLLIIYFSFPYKDPSCLLLLAAEAAPLMLAVEFWRSVSRALFLRKAQKPPGIEAKMSCQIKLILSCSASPSDAPEPFLPWQLQLLSEVTSTTSFPSFAASGWRQINKHEQEHFNPVLYVAKNSSQMEKIFPEVFCFIICFK